VEAKTFLKMPAKVKNELNGHFAPIGSKWETPQVLAGCHRQEPFLLMQRRAA